MNTLQLEAMDRNCELPEVIFATSPHPLAPTCTGVGGEQLPRQSADWCERCGCGNDKRGYAHLDACPTQKVPVLQAIIRNVPDIGDKFAREWTIASMAYAAGRAALTKNSEATP